MNRDNADDWDIFLQSYVGLCHFFNLEADELKMEVYFKALSSFPVQDVVQGIDKAIARCRFFPKPVELLEFIEGKIEHRAEVEGLKVLEALKTLSRTNAVVFDDPVTAGVVERAYGGWWKLASTHKEANDTWFIKDFRQRYVAFTEQGVKHIGVLKGEYGTKNIALIGNSEKAQAALEAGKKQQDSQITMLTGGLKKQMALRA